MAISRTTVVAVVAVAIVGIGVALFYLNRPVRRVSPPPGSEFPACKHPTGPVNPHCIDINCGNVPGFPPFTKFDTAVEGTFMGINSLYCCPAGTDLMLGAVPPRETCKVR
jgi:hypothetical protein